MKSFQTPRRTDKTTEDGQRVIKKAHLNLWFRRVKMFQVPIDIMINSELLIENKDDTNNLEY